MTDKIAKAKAVQSFARKTEYDNRIREAYALVPYIPSRGNMAGFKKIIEGSNPKQLQYCVIIEPPKEYSDKKKYHYGTALKKYILKACGNHGKLDRNIIVKTEQDTEEKRREYAELNSYFDAEITITSEKSVGTLAIRGQTMLTVKEYLFKNNTNDSTNKVDLKNGSNSAPPTLTKKRKGHLPLSESASGNNSDLSEESEYLSTDSSVSESSAHDTSSSTEGPTQTAKSSDKQKQKESKNVAQNAKSSAVISNGNLPKPPAVTSGSPPITNVASVRMKQNGKTISLKPAEPVANSIVKLTRPRIPAVKSQPRPRVIDSEKLLKKTSDKTSAVKSPSPPLLPPSASTPLLIHPSVTKASGAPSALVAGWTAAANALPESAMQLSARAVLPVSADQAKSLTPDAVNNVDEVLAKGDQISPTGDTRPAKRIKFVMRQEEAVSIVSTAAEVAAAVLGTSTNPASGNINSDVDNRTDHLEAGENREINSTDVDQKPAVDLPKSVLNHLNLDSFSPTSAAQAETSQVGGTLVTSPPEIVVINDDELDSLDKEVKEMEERARKESELTQKLKEQKQKEEEEEKRKQEEKRKRIEQLNKQSLENAKIYIAGRKRQIDVLKSKLAEVQAEREQLAARPVPKDESLDKELEAAEAFFEQTKRRRESLGKSVVENSQVISSSSSAMISPPKKSP